MGKSHDDFFEGKRSWSKIKDQVLQEYMSPYLAKINTLNRPILLIDGYAGRGVFNDNTYGSPIIMCEKAEEVAVENYRAFFINKSKKDHTTLTNELRRRGWSSTTTTLLGNTKLLLPKLHEKLETQSVFLYLDPFGPTGCDFALLQPFLDRNSKYSTEILLTMSMPGVHRLAGTRAIRAGRQNEQRIVENNQKLTNVFGGEYWKEILLQRASAKEREIKLIEAYTKQLGQYLSFTGFCPVRERTGKRIKYFIVFASRHPHALTLMNDAMAKAYSIGMHQADFKDGLWEEIDWQEMRSVKDLGRIIITMITDHPGETRENIWFRIAQKHFTTYLQKEYHAEVQRLVKDGKITFNSSTGRLNDTSELHIAQTQRYSNIKLW